jgi:hypothetical protein
MEYVPTRLMRRRQTITFNNYPICSIAYQIYKTIFINNKRESINYGVGVMINFKIVMQSCRSFVP